MKTTLIILVLVVNLIAQTPYMSWLLKTNQENLIWNNNTSLDDNKWTPICWVKSYPKANSAPYQTYVKDTIRVDFWDEMGNKFQVKCTAVFESTSQFKLSAPWMPKSLVIQKTNLSNISPVKIGE